MQQTLYRCNTAMLGRVNHEITSQHRLIKCSAPERTLEGRSQVRNIDSYNAGEELEILSMKYDIARQAEGKWLLPFIKYHQKIMY
jgi:hypothetical protein